MAILKVAQLGHPILRRKADLVPVPLIREQTVQELIADMKDTLVDQDGLGLAAPQVHASIRLVLVEQQGVPMVLINPVITPLTDDRVRSWEGCLSMPGMRGVVERIAQVRVQALSNLGEPLDFEAEDLDAIVVQHECDHLDGVVYVDRTEIRTLAYMPEYRRYGPILAPDLYEEEGEEGDEREGENGEAEGEA